MTSDELKLNNLADKINSRIEEIFDTPTFAKFMVFLLTDTTYGVLTINKTQIKDCATMAFFLQLYETWVETGKKPPNDLWGFHNSETRVWIPNAQRGLGHAIFAYTKAAIEVSQVTTLVIEKVLEIQLSMLDQLIQEDKEKVFGWEDYQNTEKEL